ncbi:MAG: TetR/AcrR family transcriptional regulator, partial [Bacteroidota bacterium]
VIIGVLYENMESSLQVYWEGLNQVPSFANVARYLTYFLQLQEAYSFFYQDMLEIERSHPEIGEKHQVHIERQIANVRAMIDYSVQAGNMQPEARSGLYDHLANTVWMMLNFWLTQKQIRKQAAQTSAMEAIWMLVIPHLTTKGEAHLASLIPETIPLHP